MEKCKVIAIDHGWSAIKTPNTTFVAGVREMSTEPALSDKVLVWQERYYRIGSERLEVQENKVANDNYYLLTMAAIAEELKLCGRTKANVILAVGLPLTRFGAEKEEFLKYLRRKRQMIFSYEGKKYDVTLEDIKIYPQCYAAVIEHISEYAKNQLIVDIGSWTVDIMPTVKQLPDEAKARTIPKGLITCMRKINEELVRSVGGEISEQDMQEVMINGKSDLPEEYLSVVIGCLKEYADTIYQTLRECGYNLAVTPVTFVGGGAGVMEKFADNKNYRVSFVADVKANAKGYKYLTDFALRSKR